MKRIPSACVSGLVEAYWNPNRPFAPCLSVDWLKARQTQPLHHGGVCVWVWVSVAVYPVIPALITALTRGGGERGGAADDDAAYSCFCQRCINYILIRAGVLRGSAEKVHWLSIAVRLWRRGWASETTNSRHTDARRCFSKNTTPHVGARMCLEMSITVRWTRNSTWRFTNPARKKKKKRRRLSCLERIIIHDGCWHDLVLAEWKFLSIHQSCIFFSFIYLFFFLPSGIRQRRLFLLWW